MPFGVVSGVRLVMGVLDGGDESKGKGQFWGEFGAFRCNQWGLCDALFSNYFEDLLCLILFFLKTIQEIGWEELAHLHYDPFLCLVGR